jgi:hypothetical protein
MVLTGRLFLQIIAKGDLEDCQPPPLTVEKGKSPLDVMHILDDSNGLDNKNNVKVLNAVPSSSNTSDLLLLAEVDDDQIKLNEEEFSENPSNNDIHEELNEPQRTAPQVNANQKIKVYQISALQSFLNVCGHSELACFCQKQSLCKAPS